MAITTGDAVPGELITAAWGDAVRADLTLHDTHLTAILATQKVYAATVSVTTNAQGIVGVPIPPGTFHPAGGATVWAFNPDNAGGNPANWIDVITYAAGPTNFNIQAAKRNTATPTVGTFLLSFIAVGTRP